MHMVNRVRLREAGSWIQRDDEIPMTALELAPRITGVPTYKTGADTLAESSPLVMTKGALRQ